jgi:hypothetical protein
MRYPGFLLATGQSVKATRSLYVIARLLPLRFVYSPFCKFDRLGASRAVLDGEAKVITLAVEVEVAVSCLRRPRGRRSRGGSVGLGPFAKAQAGAGWGHRSNRPGR